MNEHILNFLNLSLISENINFSAQVQNSHLLITWITPHNFRSGTLLSHFFSFEKNLTFYSNWLYTYIFLCRSHAPSRKIGKSREFLFGLKISGESPNIAKNLENRSLTPEKLANCLHALLHQAKTLIFPDFLCFSHVEMYFYK